MPTLLLRFPAGRYHATPWGHHVNEGLVEWPPSPWRLLRALVACGYATQGWHDVPPAGRRLIEALSGVLPSYCLPRATVAHSRHFMPTGVIDKGREKTTLVFDTWADVGAGEMAVSWDCALDDEAFALFARLASLLGYLGRAESWVTAQADAGVTPDAGQCDAHPHVDGPHKGPGWEQVSLMAAEPHASYADWRRQVVTAALGGIPAVEGKKKVPAKVVKAREAAQAPYPEDLLDCLRRDTAWWKRYRWSRPPGSRRVLYWRRADSLSVAPPVDLVEKPVSRVPMMLLALTTPSGRLSALPPVARTLPQAELIHRALVSWVGRGRRVECPELIGRDAHARPLTGHRHACVFPLDLDGDGRIDHVVVHAAMGLGPQAQAAVRGLDRTWTKGGVGDLALSVAGSGDLDRLRDLPPPFDRGVERLLGPRGGARVWRNVTPLVLPRFQKRRGANTIEGQIAAELTSRGLPPAAVSVLPWDEKTRALRHAVRVRRPPAGPPPADTGFAVELIFEERCPGPISLGYASHFGLGLFSAVDSGRLVAGALDTNGRQDGLTVP